MEELLPLQLSHTFKCKIIASKLTHQLNNNKFYQCSTNFGIMTLLIEEVFTSSKQKSKDYKEYQKQTGATPSTKLQKRNQFLTSFPFCTFIPVIYEQHIITSHKDRSVCLTLMQPIQVLNSIQIIDNAKIQQEKSLILAFKAFQETNEWSLNVQEIQKQHNLILFRSLLSDQLLIDFTRIQHSKKSQQKQPHHTQIKKILDDIFPKQQNPPPQEAISRIILIKDRLYRISREKISSRNFSSWFEVGVCLNFLQEEQVMIKTKQKSKDGQIVERTKRIHIKNLPASESPKEIQIFDCKSNQSKGSFHFYDGHCTDMLQPVEYDDLLKHFFIDNSTYRLKKDIYLWIQRVQNTPESNKQLGTKKNRSKRDTIHIQNGVQKWQCINFFITYCKFIQPTLKNIHFVKESNTLIFKFLGKWKTERQLNLEFEPDYVIKDEQLSMIIEKSKIQDLTLELSGMSITDSFLMFLANSQKMTKIKHLDISQCQKVTQNGVNSLLISPFCKNLNYLNVSGTPIVQSSIQSLLKKGQLKDLLMNNCPTEDDQQPNYFVIKNSKLTRLEAMGMNISGNFGSSLKILKIGSLMPLQFLKQLKDMPLSQLTVRLFEEKKNLIGGLMGTIGTLYSSKQIHPIKSFVEGTIASKNIRFLDLSHSTTKLKSLKPFFTMPELQTLRLQNLSYCQQIDFSLSQKVIDLSLKNSQISLRDFSHLVKAMKILLKLDISNTPIRKDEIVDFFASGKKYVNTLVISQNQYSMSLIDPNSKSSQFVETFQLACGGEFFNLKNEHLITNLLFKSLRSNKNLKFTTSQQSKTMSFLSKYINWFNIDQIRNIFINDKPLKLVYESQKQKQEKSQKINCGQFLQVHLRHKRPIVVNLFNHSKEIEGCQRWGQQNNNGLVSIYSEITIFTYLYRKTVLNYPQGTIDISLHGNKVISCASAISLIKVYSNQAHIKSIDLSACTLPHPDLLPSVIDLPHLQSLNHNQYQVFLNKTTFPCLSQKYLKFFMRIPTITKLTLSFQQIPQTEILFSIFFHVLDFHDSSIEEITLSFDGIKMCRHNTENFWEKLCQMKRLKILKINLNKCTNTANLKYILEKHQLNKYQQLECIEITGLECINIPSVFNGQSVKRLSLNLQNSSANQPLLTKLLKPYSRSLTSLTLNLSQCDNLLHPGRLLPALSQFKSLQHLKLSLQYCPLKQLSTIDFLQGLYSFKSLTELQIDLSFTPITYNMIANIVASLPLKLPKCHAILYLIGNQPKEIPIDKDLLQSQGIEIIS